MKHYVFDYDGALHCLGTFKGDDAGDQAVDAAVELLGNFYFVFNEVEMLGYMQVYCRDNDGRHRR